MRQSGGLFGVLSVSVLLLTLNAIEADRAQAQGANPNQGQQQSGSDLNTLSQDQKQWVMAPKDYANTRFSGLDQINTGNVGNLQAAWSFSLGSNRGQEAAPLVIDGTMYVVGPYVLPHPNQVFALDPTNGDLKWSYYPKPNPSAEGVACCDVVSRGIAYDNGKIFLATLDMNAVAIDAKTGNELWHTSLGDINQGETVTMAPLSVKGKILIGNSGGEMGVRGWLTAVDETMAKSSGAPMRRGPTRTY